MGTRSTPRIRLPMGIVLAATCSQPPGVERGRENDGACESRSCMGRRCWWWPVCWSAGDQSDQRRARDAHLLPPKHPSHRHPTPYKPNNTRTWSRAQIQAGPGARQKVILAIELNQLERRTRAVPCTDRHALDVSDEHAPVRPFSTTQARQLRQRAIQRLPAHACQAPTAPCSFARW